MQGLGRKYWVTNFLGRHHHQFLTFLELSMSHAHKVQTKKNVCDNISVVVLLAVSDEPNSLWDELCGGFPDCTN